MAKKNKKYKTAWNKYSSLPNIYESYNMSKEEYCNSHDKFIRAEHTINALSNSNNPFFYYFLKHKENQHYTYKAYYEGNGIHLFLENSELYDFLNETCLNESHTGNMIESGFPILHPYFHKISSFGRIFPIVDEPSMRKKYEMIEWDEENIEYNVYLFIHHKKLNMDSKAYCLSFQKDNMNYRLAFITEITGTKLIPTYECHTGIFKDDNFLINLLSYIEAFPELLVEGTPDDRKEFLKTCKNQNARKVKSNKKIKGSGTEGKSDGTRKKPHIRKGHFRRLKSDRYVNAKGQVIFVNSSMVKGRAKKVIDLGDSLSDEIYENDSKEFIDVKCDEYSEELRKDIQKAS